MTTIPLRDILINARQESARMRHFYLGVEHLFIALLEIPGGLGASILEDQGLTARYVIDAVRRKIGKGGDNRLWAGMPNTPRADVVLGIANDLALEAGHTEINERDLLAAVLEEQDSLPVRVLNHLGLDMDALADAVHSRSTESSTARAYIRIIFGTNYEDEKDITDDQLFILRRMFYGYGQLRIERQLRGGYTDALLLVVTPIHPDGIEDASVVVKIDYADTILDEARRYELYVKGTLPPLVARIEDRPTAPETSNLAGIKYTFVSEDGVSPQDLRTIVSDWGADKLGRWLHMQLYPYFGKTWWLQRRPFRFQAWMEYDWLLPPVLTLEHIEAEAPPPNSIVIKDPVRRQKLAQIEYGDVVVIENFTVQKVLRDRKRLQLASGRGTEAATRAYKIDLREVNLAQNTYYRGEVVPRLVGRVFKTRDELLRLAASALQPPFDLQADFIPGVDEGSKIANPLKVYDVVLDHYVNGSVSKIHGDLHLGNIVVGPNNSPFLIDFAQTRDGHTLSDWAMLEVSLLGEVVMPSAGDDWDSAYRVLGYVAQLNALKSPPATTDAANNMKAVEAVRRIARECLQRPDQWEEYFIALAFCAMRGMMWETLSLGSRRLMFLLAALSLREVQRRSRDGAGETLPDMDHTDTGETDTE